MQSIEIPIELSSAPPPFFNPTVCDGMSSHDWSHTDSHQHNIQSVCDYECAWLSSSVEEKWTAQKKDKNAIKLQISSQATQLVREKKPN